MAMFRASVMSQVIGLSPFAASRSALCHMRTKISCSASSASCRSFKTRRQIPKSFALVAS
jgi:hypothetical protein